MIMPIYDYEKQKWTEIHPQTDELISSDRDLSHDVRLTPDGVCYEYRRVDGFYRNAMRV